MGNTEIPKGFKDGYAIAVKSDQEIWLIGGIGSSERILRFNVKDHTFQELPSKLIWPRHGHRCAFIPGTNKIIITGGCDKVFTEVLDTESGDVSLGSPMNMERSEHGIGVVTVNGEDRVAVFGGAVGKGEIANHVELYNHETKNWETSNIRLKENNYGFGFLTVKQDIFLNSEILA